MTVPGSLPKGEEREGEGALSRKAGKLSRKESSRKALIVNTTHVAEKKDRGEKKPEIMMTSGDGIAVVVYVRNVRARIISNGHFGYRSYFSK